MYICLRNQKKIALEILADKISYFILNCKSYCKFFFKHTPYRTKGNCANALRSFSSLVNISKKINYEINELVTFI